MGKAARLASDGPATGTGWAQGCRQTRQAPWGVLFVFVYLFVYCSYVTRRSHDMTPGGAGRKLCVLSHRVYFQFDVLCDLDTIFMVPVHCEFQPLQNGNYTQSPCNAVIKH